MLAGIFRLSFIKNEQNRVRNCRNILAKKYHLYVLSQMERGAFYENGKRKTFDWLYKRKKVKINNVSRIFFQKRNLQLLIRNMFCHNNKIYMELENESGDIYVLSLKKRNSPEEAF